MKNYCRWCYACNDIGIGDYYCVVKDIFLTTKTVKSWACKSFGDCGIDVITGKERKDRNLTTRRKKVNDGTQIKLEVVSWEE